MYGKLTSVRVADGNENVPLSQRVAAAKYRYLVRGWPEQGRLPMPAREVAALPSVEMLQSMAGLGFGGSVRGGQDSVYKALGKSAV